MDLLQLCIQWHLKCSTFGFTLQFRNPRLYIANWRSHQVLQFSAIPVETHAKEKFWEFRTNISILSALFAKVSVCDSCYYEECINIGHVTSRYWKLHKNNLQCNPCLRGIIVNCTTAYCKSVNILNPKSGVCFEWI